MPDKSFEEKVQEQLADLRMKPDAATWERVAAALHQEKKRRSLIWLMILLAGLGSGYCWFRQQSSTPNPITARQQTATGLQKLQQQNDHREAITIRTSPEKPGIEAGDSKPARPAGGPAQRIHSGGPAQRIHSGGPAQRIHSGGPALKGNGVKTNEVVQAIPAKQQAANDPAGIVAAETGKITLATNRRMPDTTAVSEGILERAVPVAGKVGARQEVTSKDAVVLITDSNDSAVKTIPVTEAVAVKPQPDIQLKKKYPWRWHFSAQAGMSGTRNSLGGVLSKSFEEKSAYASSSQGSNVPATGGGLGYKPAPRDAFSYGITIQATKQINKKQQLGFSLGYELCQTLTGVGKRTDSTIFFSSANRLNDAGFYYSSKDSNNYNNRYHFLQVSTSLYTPVPIFKKIPIRWQLGAGMNLLLASNGLHYGSAGNNYYLFSSRSLLRTVQVQFSTGFDIGIGKQQLVYIGPGFRYFITNLSKQPGVTQHLFQAVLKTTVGIPKKNKQVQR